MNMATLAPWFCADCGKLWETTYWPELPTLCPYCKENKVIVDVDFDTRYIRREV
jgi:hypothetical protein